MGIGLLFGLLLVHQGMKMVQLRLSCVREQRSSQYDATK